MTSTLETLEDQVRQLHDRALISERVIGYALAVDRRDWRMFGDCFTDPVYVDYSASGVPAGEFSRADLVALVRGAIDGFTHTQHLSPNHVVEFDEQDPERAVCHSYMYAQHHLAGLKNNRETGTGGGEFFLLRGSYTNRMLRTGQDWRIEGLIQHVSWADGNLNAVSEARARLTG
jgi:hypothetical protein